MIYNDTDDVDGRGGGDVDDGDDDDDGFGALVRTSSSGASQAQ